VLRRITHPGPAAAERSTVVPTTLRQASLTLAPGRTLLQAVSEALAAHGAHSAVLQLGTGTLFPFAHVMPALSTSAEHAVYFSARFDAAAPVRLDIATVTVGQRDGQPSLHCHAQWHTADGTRHIGHVLPGDAVLTEAIAAQAWLLDGAAFVAQPDDETRFTLFKPMAVLRSTVATTAAAAAADTGSAAAAEPNTTGERQALAVRLAPNADVCSALEAVCRQHGLRSATVRGGVGSTVGAAFADGRRVLPYVTELLVRQGRVRPDAQGQPVAEIDVSLVDHTGGLAEGRLQRGANPVLVTFELVLQAD
jgi:predicted DNA-binding protein with PD1-like motif